MKNLAILAVLFCTITLAQGQNKNPWRDLSDVQIMTRQPDDSPFPIQYPVFGPKALALDGKTITLRGYMVPLDDMLGQNYFVLSSLPFNLCYFCGGAGPETVMEVFTKKEIPFDSDIITIRGTLELNPDDPDRLMYILRKAELVEE